MWREWAYNVDASYMDNWDYQYVIDGDTVVSGNSYHKILKTGTFSHASASSYNYNYVNQYIGCYREDNYKHILYCQSGEQVEQVLYDFSLNLGDTLPQSFINNSSTGTGNWVSKIDSIMVGGSFHKQFHISTANDSNYVSLIEGVGSTFGLLGQLRPVFESESHLSCYTHNGITEYSDNQSATCTPVILGVEDHFSTKKISVYPNPTTGIINLKVPQNEKIEFCIVNILGEVVSLKLAGSNECSIDLSQFPKGLYFLKATSNNIVVSTQKIALQ
jgi:hypothetical protein